MPMIYRLWAARRARLWAAWRLLWPGETPFEGADSLAWEASLHMEAAAARGVYFAMVALDWKKAYDGISLEILSRILSEAGVPWWARGPMLHMYQAERRLRVGRAIGEPWAPSCGIPAGCPIAVFALAVCTRPWACLADSLEGIIRRLYVDDSTAWATGTREAVTTAIAGVVHLTRRFERGKCTPLSQW